jgi:hypothetical protein
MMPRILSVSIIVLFIAVLSSPVYGQQDDDAALLPDIDPQDIEIRGQFLARFPGLRRQPILGFDPSLRIYQIDPNRQPFMETGDEVVASLPVSELTRPAPPAYNALQYNDEIYAYSRIGVGSFTSPEAQFWGVLPINEQSYIGVDLDFSSSDGHLDEQPSSFRFLTGNAEFGTKLDEKTKLQLYGGGQSDFNHPAEFSAGVLNETVNIEHQGFHAGAELSRFKNDIAGWQLQGNVRNFSTHFESQTFPGTIDELTYSGSFSNRWALGNPGETFTLKAGGRGGNYEPENLESQIWSTLQGGIVYERLFNYNTQLHAEADVFYTTNIQEDNVYPGGLLEINHWFGDRLKVTGKVQGKPQLKTVEQLHEHNRFLGVENDLVHTYSIDVTGEAEIKYYRGSKLHGGVTYTNAQNYAFFLPETQRVPIGERLDTYTVNYQNATNFKLFAGITHQLLPERFWISGQAYLQNPELDGGDDIPFEENFGVNASMSLRPIDRITIEGWADYVGERNTNITNNNTVGDFFLVGGQLDVEVTNNFGAYLKLVNILGQEYEVFEGYEERPFQVYGGLTIKF